MALPCMNHAISSIGLKRIIHERRNRKNHHRLDTRCRSPRARQVPDGVEYWGNCRRKVDPFVWFLGQHGMAQRCTFICPLKNRAYGDHVDNNVPFFKASVKLRLFPESSAAACSVMPAALPSPEAPPQSEGGEQQQVSVPDVPAGGPPEEIKDDLTLRVRRVGHAALQEEARSPIHSAAVLQNPVR